MAAKMIGATRIFRNGGILPANVAFPVADDEVEGLKARGFHLVTDKLQNAESKTMESLRNKSPKKPIKKETPSEEASDDDNPFSLIAEDKESK